MYRKGKIRNINEFWDLISVLILLKNTREKN